MRSRSARAGALLSRILVATDFSRESMWAGRRAILLPLATGARVTLVHALPGGLDPRHVVAATAAAREALEAQAEQLRVAAARAGATVEIVPRLAQGQLFASFETIVREAGSARAEVVVLGRRGTGLGSLLRLGSTASRVVRRSDKPVLVVTRRPSSPHARAVVAVDHEDAAAGPALDWAFRLPHASVQPVVVVHSTHLPFEATWRRALSAAKFTAASREFRRSAAKSVRDLASAVAERHGAAFRLVVRTGDARTVIPREAARAGADVLVLGTNARTGLARGLLGSVAEEVLHSAPCDVLVVRPRGTGRRPA